MSKLGDYLSEVYNDPETPEEVARFIKDLNIRLEHGEFEEDDDFDNEAWNNQ